MGEWAYDRSSQLTSLTLSQALAVVIYSLNASSKVGSLACVFDD
jgi:hypothetical protein